jgi:DNA polymerase-3 subunit epsilon
MILCGVDIETTGVELTSEITELSYVFMEVPLFKTPPVIRQHFCIIEEETIPSEITDLTGIDKRFLGTFAMGNSVKNAIWLFEQELAIYQPDYIVAHNGQLFDKPMIEHWAKKHSLVCHRISKTPWIDTAADLPEGSFPTNKLSYMAAECGFLNPFPHSAVLDILTMFRVLAKCDIDKVIERLKEPWVTVQALVDYNTKDLAKKRKFRWQDCGDGKTYDKTWVKRIKQCDLDQEKSSSDFKIVVIG